MTARRRFYKTVTVTEALGIALDGRPVKTPLKAVLQLPTPALAGAAEAYVAGVDAARVWVDGQIQGLIGKLRGLEGASQG